MVAHGWAWASGCWVWLVLAVVVVWLIDRGLITLERTRTEGRVGSRPEEILRERFARGEIDPDEFERRLAALHGK